MEKEKQEQLAAGGWVTSSVQEFLDLTDEEIAYIEVKQRLSKALRKTRLAKGLTQAQFAALVQYSQSRVSKMETGDPTISLDLLVRGLLALDATDENLARAIAPA